MLEGCLVAAIGQTVVSCANIPIRQAVARCFIVAENRGNETAAPALRLIAPDVNFAQQLVTASLAFTSDAGLPPVNWTLPPPPRIAAVMGADLRPDGLRSFHAYVMPASAIADLTDLLGVAQDLSALVTDDPVLDWPGFLPLYRDVLAVYDGRVQAIPAQGMMLQLYYRRDLLGGADRPVPRTWGEVLSYARYFNGTDLNGDDEPDFGICMWNEACDGVSAALVAILASLVQSKGRKSGLFFEPENLRCVVDTVAWDMALDLARQLTLVAAPVAIKPPSYDNPCFSQPLFTLGRCAMALGTAGQFKADSSPYNPLSRIRGKVGSAVLPGSELVLDWRTNTLVRCNSERCPFASQHVRLPELNRAAVATAAGPTSVAEPALADALTAAPSSPGAATTAGSVTATVSAVGPAGEVVWANHAPYGMAGGISIFISRRQSMPQQLATYELVVGMVRDAGNWPLVAAPGSEFGPTRYEHLDETTAPGRWAAYGYHPDDLASFLAASRESLSSGNVALDLRAEGGLRMKELLLVITRLVANTSIPLPQAVNTSRTLIRDLLTPAFLARLASSYRKTTIFREPSEPPFPGAAAPATPSGTGSRVATLVLLSVAVVLGTAALAVAAGFVVWYLSKSRRKRQGGVRVTAPGAGPATTLCITDIEGSTRLWECLPEAVMSQAVQLHHECLRRCAAANGGYESAWEGDSFILAFHHPRAALQFCMETQELLPRLPWPQELLQVDICRPVYLAEGGLDGGLTPGAPASASVQQRSWAPPSAPQRFLPRASAYTSLRPAGPVAPTTAVLVDSEDPRAAPHPIPGSFSTCVVRAGGLPYTPARPALAVRMQPGQGAASIGSVKWNGMGSGGPMRFSLPLLEPATPSDRCESPLPAVAPTAAAPAAMTPGGTGGRRRLTGSLRRSMQQQLSADVGSRWRGYALLDLRRTSLEGRAAIATGIEASGGDGAVDPLDSPANVMGTGKVEPVCLDVAAGTGSDTADDSLLVSVAGTASVHPVSEDVTGAGAGAAAGDPKAEASAMPLTSRSFDGALVRGSGGGNPQPEAGFQLGCNKRPHPVRPARARPPSLNALMESFRRGVISALSNAGSERPRPDHTAASTRNRTNLRHSSAFSGSGAAVYDGPRSCTVRELYGNAFGFFLAPVIGQTSHSRAPVVRWPSVTSPPPASSSPPSSSPPPSPPLSRRSSASSSSPSRAMPTVLTVPPTHRRSASCNGSSASNVGPGDRRTSEGGSAAVGFGHNSGRPRQLTSGLDAEASRPLNVAPRRSDSKPTPVRATSQRAVEAQPTSTTSTGARLCTGVGKRSATRDRSGRFEGTPARAVQFTVAAAAPANSADGTDLLAAGGQGGSSRRRGPPFDRFPDVTQQCPVRGRPGGLGLPVLTRGSAGSGRVTEQGTTGGTTGEQGSTGGGSQLEIPGARLLMRGLRVRMGCHSGVFCAADVSYNRSMARVTYTGVPMTKARAVVSAAHGGMVLLSSAAHALVTASETNAGTFPTGGLPGQTKAQRSTSGTNAATAASISVTACFRSDVLFWHAGVHDLDDNLSRPLELFLAGSPQLTPRWALLAEPGPSDTCRTITRGVAAAPVGEVCLAAVTVAGGAEIEAWNAGVWHDSMAALWRHAAVLCRQHGGFLATARCSAGTLPSQRRRDSLGGAQAQLTAVFPAAAAAIRWAASLIAWGLLAAWPPALLLHEMAEAQLWLKDVTDAQMETPHVLAAAAACAVASLSDGAGVPAGAAGSQDPLKRRMKLAGSDRSPVSFCETDERAQAAPGQSAGPARMVPGPGPDRSIRAEKDPSAGGHVTGDRTAGVQAQQPQQNTLVVVAAGGGIQAVPWRRGARPLAVSGVAKGTSSLGSRRPPGSLLDDLTSSVGGTTSSASVALPLRLPVREAVFLPGHDSRMPALEKVDGLACGAVTRNHMWGAEGCSGGSSASPPADTAALDLTLSLPVGPRPHAAVRAAPEPTPSPSSEIVPTPAGTCATASFVATAAASAAAATIPRSGSAWRSTIGLLDPTGSLSGRRSSISPHPPTVASVSISPGSQPLAELTPDPRHQSRSKLPGTAVRPSALQLTPSSSALGVTLAAAQVTPSQAVRLFAERCLNPSSSDTLAIAQQDGGWRSERPSQPGAQLPDSVLDVIISRGLRLRAGVALGVATVEVSCTTGEARYGGPAAVQALALAERAPVSHVVASTAALRASGNPGGLADLPAAVAARVRIDPDS